MIPTVTAKSPGCFPEIPTSTADKQEAFTFSTHCRDAPELQQLITSACYASNKEDLIKYITHTAPVILNNIGERLCEIIKRHPGMKAALTAYVSRLNTSDPGNAAIKEFLTKL